MTRRTTFMSALALSTAITAVAACDTTTTDSALSAITQAVSADDAAAGDEVGDGDDATDRDHDRPPPPPGEGGGCGDGGMRPPPPDGMPPPPEGDRYDVDLPVCEPPVADDVELMRPPMPRDHLAAIYDDDESGDLDDTELAALQADVSAGCDARNASALDEFDSDDDGELSQAEWDALITAKRAEFEADRDALDTDGDGTISREEHEAADAELISTWDADDSGDLDADERAAMRTDLKALVRAGERLPPLPFPGAHHGPPPEGPPPPPQG